MVSTSDCLLVIWWTLKVAFPVVVWLEDARDATNPHSAIPHNARVTEVVDVGRHPPAVRQLLQVVGCLVVPTDEHREDRGLLLARVVPGRAVRIRSAPHICWECFPASPGENCSPSHLPHLRLAAAVFRCRWAPPPAVLRELQRKTTTFSRRHSSRCFAGGHY